LFLFSAGPTLLAFSFCCSMECRLYRFIWTSQKSNSNKKIEDPHWVCTFTFHLDPQSCPPKARNGYIFSIGFASSVSLTSSLCV
jgi:hypothetical protein